MTVKSIFKILLGTIVIMVTSMLLIELFNVSIASYQLRQICRMSARQACILFTSETYKGDESVGGSIGIQDIMDSEGKLYLSGNFYGISPSEPDYTRKVWNKIYKSEKFKDFLDHTPAVNKYYAIKILKKVLNNEMSYSEPTWDSSSAELAEAVDASTAMSYHNNYYTTANVGIPYIDKDIGTKMYQWNLTQLLSNCQPASIQRDGSSQMCVNFMGFRVYTNKCELTNFKYRVYDVSKKNSNRAYAAEEVWKDLNIDVTDTGSHSYGIVGNRQRQMFETTTIDGRIVYDNQYITAVGLEYNLVATYEGITPLRNVIAYVFNNQVSGFNRDGEGVNTPPDYSGTGEAQILDRPMDTDVLNIGGFDGRVDSKVIKTGKLVYTLDR